jgi:deoxyribodipyrimidine photo-lyase
MKLGIFIFRRDLRLQDNTTLLLLNKECDYIMPIFILDENQIKENRHNKNYFSYNATQFICESLQDLDKQLKKKNSKLHLYYGDVKKTILKIIKELENKYELKIGFNKDYSEYSIERDSAIQLICMNNNIELITEHDIALIDFDKMLLGGITAYKQFGPFYKNAIKTEPLKPVNSDINFTKIASHGYNIKELDKLHKGNDNLKQKGNRNFFIKILNNIDKFSNYDDIKNDLSCDTTNLSAGLNLGLISCRETYWKVKNIESIKKQLYWRDFYLCAYNNLENGKSFFKLLDSRYELIDWTLTDLKICYWDKMIQGKTGFLIIDASINEMKQTGFLHGRCRMLLGIFWTKYLQINILDNKYGSQTGFSKYLLDAIGPTQNKMNHHWILDFDYAGKKFSKTGTISGRPMNIDNSIIKKLDKDCKYIKKWLPQFNDIENKEIYKWSNVIANKYSIHPGPIFDAKEKYKEWIELCRGI